MNITYYIDHMKVAYNVSTMLYYLLHNQTKLHVLNDIYKFVIGYATRSKYPKRNICIQFSPPAPSLLADNLK